MSERREVGDFLSVHARPTFTPQAAPVDTYVRARVEPGSGDALLNALSQLDQALSPTLKKEMRREARKEKAEGEALFQKNRKDFAQAVRDGDIPVGASPFVRRGYRESQLHVLGATYDVELKRALEHSNLHEVDNPAEVEEFIQAFNEKFYETNGLSGLPSREVNSVFTPIARRANDNFRSNQASRNIEYVEEQRFRTFEAELYMAVNQGRFTGPEGSAAADAESLTQWLKLRTQELYEEGVDYELIERSVLKAVGQAAIDRGSVNIANVLSNISVGDMPPIGQSAAGRDLMKSVRKAVTSAEARRHKDAEKAVKEAEKERVRSLQTDAQQAAMDGDFDAAEELLRGLNEVNPEKARAVDGLIRRYEGDVDEDIQYGAFGLTLDRIESAGSFGEAQLIINEAISTMRLDPAAANQLENIADRRFSPNSQNDTLSTYEGDQYVTGLGKSIKGRYPANELGIPLPENADRAAAAKVFYEDQMLDWFSQNTGPDGKYDRLEARKYANQVIEEALKLYPAGEEEPVPEWAN